MSARTPEDHMMLKNKVALVIGASSGTGRAVALVWAREGARVVVSDMNRIGGEEPVALVRVKGGAAIFQAADVRQPKDAQSLVEQTVAQFGWLDLACNKAGIGGQGHADRSAPHRPSGPARGSGGTGGVAVLRKSLVRDGWLLPGGRWLPGALAVQKPARV